MNSMKSKIALLGTSADPPTFGHQALLEGLLTLFPQVATWASNNPMKKHGASLESRSCLLNALVKTINDPNLELMQDLSNPKTIKTLEKATQKWPNSDLTFVIGSDLTCQIPNWSHAQKILQKARLAIAPREGWPIKKSHLKILEALGGEIDLLPLKIPETSSSWARNNAKANQIPPAVLKILLKQNLYGISNEKQ